MQGTFECASTHANSTVFFIEERNQVGGLPEVYKVEVSQTMTSKNSLHKNVSSASADNPYLFTKTTKENEVLTRTASNMRSSRLFVSLKILLGASMNCFLNKTKRRIYTFTNEK